MFCQICAFNEINDLGPKSDVILNDILSSVHFVGKECFDMQHSHEAMTYQDEVIDEHEPAEKNTLHNGCPFSFNSLRLQHHFQLTRALENFDDFLPTTFSLIRKNKMLLSVTDRIIIGSNFSNSKKLTFSMNLVSCPHGPPH